MSVVFLVLVAIVIRCEGFRIPTTIKNARMSHASLSAFKWPQGVTGVEDVGELAEGREQGREQVVRQYFEFWNERRMEEATSLFSPDATYEDTLYRSASKARRASIPLATCCQGASKELQICRGRANTSSCCIRREAAIVGSNGMSRRKTASSCPSQEAPLSTKSIKTGKYATVLTCPSPRFSLAILRQASTFIDSPIKAIPAAAWLFYCWFLFLSNVAPGPNALQLDPATWEEVKNLSLNFWLVLPLAGRPYRAPWPRGHI